MFKIKDEKFAGNIIDDLIKTLREYQEDLFKLNRVCTQDTRYWIKEDWQYIIDYLKNFKDNHRRIMLDKRKPKGSVLIILSYNEPLILSIAPVLCALVGGNKVKVKPSRKAQKIVKKIWMDSGIVLKHQLDLEVLFDLTPILIGNQIKVVNAVYFFGGYRTAMQIAKQCAENFVEFFPEIEAADCKIINLKNSHKVNLENDSILTLNESFSHSGQICHRIQGIIILGNSTSFQRYVSCLIKNFKALDKSQYVADDYRADKKYLKKLWEDIEEAKPKKVIKSNDNNKLPVLVICPKNDSKLIKDAYFLPILWTIGFTSEKKLLSFLNSKKYYMGLNVISKNRRFTKRIVENTRFSRYTINTLHTKIRAEEGWGGMWPSGYTGYKSWMEHFTDPYTIIEE